MCTFGYGRIQRCAIELANIDLRHIVQWPLRDKPLANLRDESRIIIIGAVDEYPLRCSTATNGLTRSYPFSLEDDALHGPVFGKYGSGVLSSMPWPVCL